MAQPPSGAVARDAAIRIRVCCRLASLALHWSDDHADGGQRRAPTRPTLLRGAAGQLAEWLTAHRRPAHARPCAPTCDSGGRAGAPAGSATGERARGAGSVTHSDITGALLDPVRTLSEGCDSIGGDAELNR